MSLGLYLLSLSRPALYLFTASVPLTYGVSYLIGPASATKQLRGLLRFGVAGALEHAVFQGLAWAFWAVSLWLNSRGPQPANVRAGVSAVLAVFAQLFMLCALLVFGYGLPDRRRFAAKAAAATPNTDDAEAVDEADAAHVTSAEGEDNGAAAAANGAPATAPLLPHSSSLGVEPGVVLSVAAVMVGFMWVSLGLGVMVASDYLPDTQSRLLYYCFAMAALVVGAFTTHGLGGDLRHGRLSRYTYPSLRRFPTRRSIASAGMMHPSASEASALASVASGFSAASEEAACEEGGGEQAVEGEGGGAPPQQQQTEKQQQEARQVGSFPKSAPGRDGGGGGGEAKAAPKSEQLRQWPSRRKKKPPRLQHAWSFYQPFRGGTVFVATQAVAWCFFSATLLGFGYFLWALARGVATCVRCWQLAAGTTMFVTQLLLAASLFTFQGGPRATRKAAVAGGRRAQVWLPMLVMYVPVHMYVTAVALSCLLVPPSAALVGWATLYAVRFAATARARPQDTGALESAHFQGWFSRNIEDALVSWMGSFEVLRDTPLLVPDPSKGSAGGDAKVYGVGGGGGDGGTDPMFDPSKRYIFGYHPHGEYPLGASYLPLTPSWQALMPGIHPVTLSASVLFFPPVIRDISIALGIRQVTRATFKQALEERGSVLVVPGGQAELTHTWRHRSRREWVAYTRHRGFVRMALETRAALVPILAFGEVDSLRNLFDMPRVHAWTYKRIGFPLPYFMVGRWGLSPFPAKTGLMFIIGNPVTLPDETPGEGGDVSTGAAADVAAIYSSSTTSGGSSSSSSGIQSGGSTEAEAEAEKEQGGVEGGDRQAGSVAADAGSSASAAAADTVQAAAAAATKAGGGDDQDEARLVALHRLYYAEVERLFVKYRSKFPGYECLEFTLEHGQ